jgi:pSer/pThr/pTyr-binding forkhead associated (FHA) protein
MRLTSTGPPSATLEYDAQAITLPRGELLVGRNSESFLRIDDPAVSRDHARLKVGDSVTLEDLGSTNGTLINGKRIDGVVQIADGDELTIGSRTFSLRLGAQEEAYDPDDETPVTQPVPIFHDTGSPRPGLGGSGEHLLERTCPNCGPVPLSTIICPGCGFHWPEGVPAGRVTAPDHLAIASLRRNGRYTARMGVRYTSKRLRVDGVVNELSKGGVFIVTTTVDSVGVRCRMELFTADGDCAEVDGFVKRVIHKGVGGITGMGIEFTRLSVMNARWIAEQIKQSCDEVPSS